MMTAEAPVVADAREAAVFGPSQIGVHVLFAGDFFAGVVLGFEPGQAVPAHRHEHKDEVFDVLAGTGEIYVADQWLSAGPGTTVYVPAGAEHALRNVGAGRWILRETVRERIYARMALRLLRRALLKRCRRLWTGKKQGQTGWTD